MDNWKSNIKWKENENKVKEYLETDFFPSFFDNGWKSIIGETKEKYIRRDSNKDRIDYYGLKQNIPTYVEVKNDRIRQKYLLQIVRYFCQANEENSIFNMYIICTKKIRPHREQILKKLGIQLLDIKDILGKGLDTWM